MVYAGVRAQRVRASCGKGEERYCLKGNIFTYGSANRDGSPTHGGFSTHIVVDQDFVLNIPGRRARRGGAAAVRGHHNLFAAAPLGRRPGKKLAVAVKLARAMGIAVTVLSQ